MRALFLFIALVGAGAGVMVALYYEILGLFIFFVFFLGFMTYVSLFTKYGRSVYFPDWVKKD